MSYGFAAFKQHVTFGFWKEPLLAERGLLPRAESGWRLLGRVTSLEDLPPERTLIKAVKAAAELNDQGIKLQRPKKTPQPVPKTPPDLPLK